MRGPWKNGAATANQRAPIVPAAATTRTILLRAVVLLILCPPGPCQRRVSPSSSEHHYTDCHELVANSSQPNSRDNRNHLRRGAGWRTHRGRSRTGAEHLSRPSCRGCLRRGYQVGAMLLTEPAVIDDDAGDTEAADRERLCEPVAKTRRRGRFNVSCVNGQPHEGTP